MYIIILLMQWYKRVYSSSYFIEIDYMHILSHVCERIGSWEKKCRLHRRTTINNVCRCLLLESKQCKQGWHCWFSEKISIFPYLPRGEREIASIYSVSRKRLNHASKWQRSDDIGCFNVPKIWLFTIRHIKYQNKIKDVEMWMSIWYIFHW
jgi:hypothetical protein